VAGENEQRYGKHDDGSECRALFAGEFGAELVENKSESHADGNAGEKERKREQGADRSFHMRRDQYCERCDSCQNRSSGYGLQIPRNKGDGESGGKRHEQEHDGAHRVGSGDFGDEEAYESDCGAREPADQNTLQRIFPVVQLSSPLAMEDSDWAAISWLAMPGTFELPNEFGAELNVTRTSAAENGIGSPEIGSECGETRIRPCQVVVNARKVGVVQDVEKLCAKLKR
jgi:hypothetical protein